MWKRRTRRGRHSSGGALRWPRVLFWALLVVETLWLAAFILSDRSLVPSLADRWLARPGTGAQRWNPAQERKLEAREEEAAELGVEKILAEKGSRGAAGPPPTAVPAK